MAKALLGPKYDGKYLREIVKEKLKDCRLSNTITNVVIPTFDIKKLQPTIFSTYETKRSDYYDAKLSDVCISTSAAPTILPAHYFEVEDDKGNVREHNLIDGSVAANNPGLVAITEISKEILKKNKDFFPIKPMDYGRFLVISIGTGAAKREQEYNSSLAAKWGIISWLFHKGSTPLFEIFTQSSADMIDYHNSVVFQALRSEDSYLRIQARAWSLEGSLKLKNLFGYGDIWDGSLAYGWDLTSEISAGVSLPRFKKLITPVTARLSLLSQDWLKFSSYKERALGLSLGLLSSRRHDLAYNLSWRTLDDPSQISSRAVRRQLGHSLISALKYTFKIDRRNSPLRPTRGYAFLSSSQIGGLLPDHRGLRFLRQELDVRYALPLGFYNAAFNFGISAGVTVPWGSGFLSRSTFLPEKFFLGGNSSPVCALGGPSSLLGFKTRGLGPAEPRRQVPGNSTDESSDASSAMDFVGGDLAVTAFADLSFDLPLRVLREAGIHGHAFACTGSLNKLTENAYKDLSFQKFKESFRASAGFGVIVPTKLFRMEVNYCYILKQQEHDRGKTGVQFSFSSSF
ncbi:Patatin-like protein 2 [Capsicum baccatum]|uniref:Patatin n=1 Tax=Capsicum baccatum TaxID=33114 RepID=A0A2G2X117_CAPBA|nr:Patatin-like protein 2 [Capsicum baccatum]